jgi:hypothetical protein
VIWQSGNYDRTILVDQHGYFDLRMLRLAGMRPVYVNLFKAQSGRECKCLAVEEVGPLFELEKSRDSVAGDQTIARRIEIVGTCAGPAELSQLDRRSKRRGRCLWAAGVG